MSQTAQSELLSASDAAERNFSTDNIIGGGCKECACEVLVRYHYDSGKGIPEAPFEMTDSKGNVYEGKTDKNGLFKAEDIACGEFDILFDEGSDEFTPIETVANNPVLQANPEYAALATEYFTLYDYLHQKGYATADADDWYGDDDVEHDIVDSHRVTDQQDQRALERFRELAQQIENDNGPLEKAIVKTHHQLAGEAADHTMVIMIAAEIILGCVPVVGDVMDIKDCATWLYDGIIGTQGCDFGDPFYLGEGALNMIGFVPVLGNAIKGSCKPIIKFLNKSDDIATAARKIRTLADGNLIKFLRKITGQLKKHADQAVDITRKIADGIASYVNKAAKWLWDSVLSVLRKFEQYAKKLVGWINEAVDNLKQWIDEFIGKFFVKKTGTPQRKGHARETELNAGADKDVNSGRKTDADENGTQTSDKAENAETPCPTGNPVNPVTGHVFEHAQDLDLPTTPALTLSRHYGPDHPAGGLFGAGWHSNLDIHLRVEDDGFYYLNADLAEIHYYDPEPGAQSRNTQHPGERLCRTEQGALYLLNPAGQRLYFGYALGRRLMLSAIEDANGHRIDVQRRPSDGFPLALHQSDGQILWFGDEREAGELDARLTHIRHQAQGVKTDVLRYHYNDHQQLSQIDGLLPHHGARYQYTPQGYIHRREDASGQTWSEYDYDDQGRVVVQRTGGGHYNGRFEYHPRHTRYHTPTGGLIDYHYDERQRVTHIETCLGAVYENHWQEHRLTVRIDPLGRTTAYAYDDWGQPVEITHPDGRTETIERDAQGRPLAYTDPLGATWQYHYDAHGNLSQWDDPLGQSQRYAYNAQGRLSQVDYPGGGQSRYAYDSAGHLRQLTSPDGQTQTYQHDALGRLVEYRDAEGHRQQWCYARNHPLPLPEQHVNPQGHTQRQQYDAQGRVIQRTDANGNRTDTTWGPYDTLRSLTDPAGRQYHFAYGPNAELTQVTNPLGETYRYVRDKAGRVVEEYDYAGAITRYTYDLAGRLVLTQKPDGTRITTVYDEGDRLIEKTLTPPQGEPVKTTYAYDDAGRLIEARQAQSHIELERDLLGRITQESHNGRVLNTTYNADGYRETLQGDNLDQHWQYGPEQQLHQLTLNHHSPLHFQYTARGQENYRYSEQGFGLMQQYDATGLLAQQQAGGRIPDLPDLPPHASTIDRRYAYDPGGRLQSLHETYWGNSHYQYDPSDRITRVEREYRGSRHYRQREAYDYNAHGDLRHAGRTASGDAVTDRAAYRQARRYQAGGKLQQAGDTHYTYDLQGRLIAKRVHKNGFRPQIWRYQWAGEDQLSRVETPDGDIWRYDYDPFGRRIQKRRIQHGKHHRPPVDPDRPIRQGSAYQWDGDRLIREAPLYADGSVAWDQADTWHYEAESFRPIAKERNGELFYVITDHLGTPREMLDERGKPTWRARFSVWGEVINRAACNDPDDAPTCNLRFQGQQYDAESGLHYNRHRYYDPASAQYLSPDPVGLAGGLAPQAYVHDPNQWVDPIGLMMEYPCAVFPQNDSQIQHIFRDAPGHLADTPENRSLLQDVASDSHTTLGTDRFGNVWSAKTQSDGSQVWVQTRNGVIQNGGLNSSPRTFNPQTGLSGN